MFYKLPYHAIPLALVILRAIFPIRHQADFIRKAQDVGQLSQQVDAESFKTVVPNQRLVRLLKHDIWLLLHRPKRSNEKQWWGQLFQFDSAHAPNWSKVMWADESLLHLTDSDSRLEFGMWKRTELKKWKKVVLFLFTEKIKKKYAELNKDCNVGKFCLHVHIGKIIRSTNVYLFTILFLEYKSVSSVELIIPIIIYVAHYPI